MKFESEGQWHQAFLEMYGPFFTGLYREVIAIVEQVEGRSISEPEAKEKVKRRFRELMHDRVPASRKAVSRVEARWEEEERERLRHAAEYEESMKQGECERLRQEEERVEAERAKHAQLVREDEENWRKKRLELETREREKQIVS